MIRTVFSDRTEDKKKIFTAYDTNYKPIWYSKEYRFDTELVKQEKDYIVFRTNLGYEAYKLITIEGEVIAEELDYKTVMNNEEIRMNKQYQDKNDNIAQKEKYLRILNKRFKEVEKYIDKYYGNQIQNKLEAISEYLATNKNLSTEEKMLSADIKKLKFEISEIKKENKMFTEESKLYKNKENAELVRVLDFYRGIIRSIKTKIKILRNSFESMTKTLNFLNKLQTNVQ